MKVRISQAVMESSEAMDPLDFIMAFFLEKRHLWDIRDPEAVKESAWFLSFKGSPAYRKKCDNLEKLYKESIYRPKGARSHSIRMEITLSGGALLKLRPDEARRCLNQPLYVLVENAQSDGAFLDAMIHAFGRKALSDAQTEGWWQIKHLGGFGETEKMIEALQAQSTGICRIFVLADSDREYPHHETATIKKVEPCCISKRIPFHILTKRKIENYLPVDVLAHVPRKRKKTYKAFLNLNSNQKDFYEMKSGFSKKVKKIGQFPASQAAIFKNIPPKTLSNLHGGFGPDIWEYFKTYRGQITRESVKLTCESDPDEIESVLNYLECML